MTTWFVSRHSGAIQWARERELPVDIFTPHLEPDRVRPGDIVIGTLPVHLAAQVCAIGARYQHLALYLPQRQRGHELSAADLEAAQAHLQEFHIQPRNPTRHA